MRTLSLTYLIGLILFVPCLSFAAENAPLAKDGLLDLREYDFKARGPLELKGEFEFYWNQMLNPSLEGDSGISSLIKVPRSWTYLRKTNPEVKRYGYATYRLIILLPEDVRELTFSVSDVFSASGYFVNGKAVEYLGYPGMNKYQTLAKYSMPLIQAKVDESRVEFLVRVSNFDHQFSGICGKIIMGLPAQMQENRNRDIYQAYFFIGAFLMIGIYFLGLFLIRSERYRLFFAIICMMMAFRVAMVYEIPLFESMHLSGQVSIRVNYLNIFFFAPFFTLMIRSIFQIDFPPAAFKAILWISLVFILIVIFGPISVFSYSLSIFFIFFIAFSLVFIYVLFLAWSRGRSHAPAFTLGLVVLFIGTLNDLLTEIEILDTPLLVHYSMLVYLLIYAYIFADKSNLLQGKTESLASELSQVRNNLENLVEQRTMELQSVSSQLEMQKQKLEVSNRELVEAMNARNRLFSIIGHDVRAPIGYLQQALDMLIESDDIDEKEREEIMNMMASSARSAYNLLDNLLLWGRSQTGRLRSNPSRFRLKDLFDESLDLVKIGLKEKGIKVEVFISEEHTVEADRDQSLVVVRNLLNNAIKFTPEKGSIYISSKKQAGEIVFSIRDTGIGIPATMLDKLFDSKSHVSTKGTHGEKGSGLGLKICYEIVQSNHGWMKVDSESGVGTTIFIGIKSAPRLV